MSEFTKGPWFIGKANNLDTNGTGIHGEDFVICDMCFDGYEESEQKANANLIAAAPDLLEALESLLDAMDASGACMYESIREDARAAIAKARGV